MLLIVVAEEKEAVPEVEVEAAVLEAAIAAAAVQEITTCWACGNGC